MTRFRFALLTLALVFTFGASDPKANAACFPCSAPDGTFVLGPPSGCCGERPLIHAFQQYGIWVCTAGCAHATGNFTCSADACQSL